MSKPTLGTISVKELQKNVGLLTRLVGNEKKHLVIVTRGLEFAVILPISDYHNLIQAKKTK
jgi:PHD/YefM family antitoxin component YafN of YafNO toxin-antitoxin module